MADQLLYTLNRASDLNGEPISGALVYVYRAGTDIPLTVYADADGDVPLEQPVAADGAGIFPPLYATETAKVVMTDPDGVVLDGYPLDPAYLMPRGSGGAGRVTFQPTAEIPVTDVQSAIERVQANIVEPLADFGLGVVGNAPLLANLDATDTGSGWYRYDGTTAGMFPAGVTAADGGVVQIRRETAAAALMELVPRGERHSFLRFMSASAWGSWVTPTLSGATWNAGTSTAVALISPALLKAAIEAVTPLKALGDIGTYGFFRRSSTGTPITKGTVYAGSALRWAGASTADGAITEWVELADNSAPAGQWRAHSSIGAIPGRYTTGLFYRVS